MKPQSLENIHAERDKEKGLHWASHFPLPKFRERGYFSPTHRQEPWGQEVWWSWDGGTLANASRTPEKFTRRFAPNWFVQGVRLYILFTEVTRIHILYCVAITSPPNWHFMIRRFRNNPCLLSSSCPCCPQPAPYLAKKKLRPRKVKWLL